MASPNAAYSVLFVLQVENVPGSLGRLAGAIGEAGGNIGAFDAVESSPTGIIRHVTVDARDADHAEQIQKVVESLEFVTVLSVADRTFQLHAGGKIEVNSRIRVETRDDLSMAYTPGVARVCRAIVERPEDGRPLTIKRNTVAGEAILRPVARRSW